MRAKDLLRAFGDIDDKYIIEKYEPIKKEKKLTFQNNVRKVNLRKEVIIMDRKILGVAAIVILMVVIFSVSTINKHEINTGSSITELVQIANPLTEVESKEEMKKYLGFDVPILNKEVESYIVIGEGKYATHARVIYKDKTQLEMEKGTKDVSGIYGGTAVKEETINGIKVQFYSYNDLNYANWTKDEFSYSYQNNNGELNLTELNTLLNK